jgi:hypothetical protein
MLIRFWLMKILLLALLSAVAERGAGAVAAIFGNLLIVMHHITNIRHFLRPCIGQIRTFSDRGI